MKFTTYLEQHIRSLLLNVLLIFFLDILFFSLSINISVLLLFSIFWFTIITVYYIIDYFLIVKQYKQLVNLVDEIDQKYLLHEIIPKPTRLENQAYYYALRKGAKAMADQVNEARINRNEYQEYIESWVHEIKTPIAALSLLNDNHQNKELKAQLDKINSLVEQVLFYARSENTQNDYLIKESALEDIVHLTLLDFRDLILGKKITLDIHDLNQIVFTDEKWIHFILNQIISNAIKYMDKEDKTIAVYSHVEENNVTLIIEDNGIGISPQELPRVFNAGYTGDDRKKVNSTGMGLYIGKKLCDRLYLGIEIESQKNKYTRVKLTFPVGKIHHLVD